MSNYETIAVHRQALERTIAVRQARLKTRRQMLKSELKARLTPKGVMSRFPITTLTIALSVGWLIGRSIRALIMPQTSQSFKPIEAPSSRSLPSSPLTQMLKEIAFQSLTNFALNKTRDFLANRLAPPRARQTQKEVTNITKPSSVNP